MTVSSHPSWWREDVHGSAWSRIREAVRRDWEQTKKDMHVGGHEMNQSMTDTVKQASGSETIPPFESANPPKVIGEWQEVEYPMAYGFGAKAIYGARYPRWNEDLSSTLRADWQNAKSQAQREWNDVEHWVRHGYEYTPKN